MCDKASSPSTEELTSSWKTTEEFFRILQVKCSGSTTELGNDSSAVPHRKEELRQEARGFLTSRIAGRSCAADANEILATKSSHEEILAIFIQNLGPAFRSDSQASRLCALYALAGAIEGCREASLSIRLANLLGTFLLGHCGPVDDEDYFDDEEDFGEQVRDAAVLGLTLLLQCQMVGNDAADNGRTEIVRIRLKLSQKALERRCAAPELDETDYDHGFGDVGQAGIHSGLSTLPRSRRSLCFDLLKAAVSGIASSFQQFNFSVEEASSLVAELSDMSSITFNCLHGESDPRCLIQLLQLFQALAVSFYPFYDTSNSPAFPLTDLFDAVAPYYPIQFNPPPNDIHGITKDGLRRALLGVLCVDQYDPVAARNNCDTMLQLALEIILERLMPPPEDDPITMSEKLEAMEDLSLLLKLSHSATAKSPSRCRRLGKLAAGHLSGVLRAVHDEASSTVAQRGGGNKERDAKRLADESRRIVANIALECERAVSDKSLWEAFVGNGLPALSRLASSSSPNGRNAIAYLACLCSSGGPMTMCETLKAGLEPLLKTISSGDEDDEAVAIYAYGIGAFFSSCQVAIIKNQKDGVVIHPHPLEAYSATAFEKLHALMCKNEKKRSPGSCSYSVQAAIIRAIEMVLAASPKEHFQQDHTAKILSFIESITSSMVLDNSAEIEETKDEMVWLNACTQTLSVFLGKAINAEDKDVKQCSRTVFEVEPLNTLLREEIFNMLASSALASTQSNTMPRPDRRVLALLCRSNPRTACRIVAVFLTSLCNSLRQDISSPSTRACAEALSFVLTYGGHNVTRACEANSMASVTSFDVLEALSDFEGDKERNGTIESIGMSNLKLPPTAEETKKVNNAIENAYTIIPFLLPLFEDTISMSHLEELVTMVSKVLPPLCESDIVKISIYLPFLSTALEHAPKPAATVSSPDICHILDTMLVDLAEFALASDFHATARSHAAAALHAAIARFVPEKDTQCPSLRIMETTILPSIKVLMQSTNNTSEMDQSTVDAVTNSLNLSALVGSAAARRAGVSSKTADKIVLFLVDLASKNRSEEEPNFNIFDESGHFLFTQISDKLAVAAANSFGSILSSESKSLLWKQRLMHIAAKRIQSISLVGNNMSLPVPTLGALIAVCYIICATSLQSVSKSTIEFFSEIIVRGLSPNGPSFGSTPSTKKLILAAVTKMFCVNPKLLTSNVYSVVTGVISAYATTADSTSDIACKLLALQALEAAVRVDNKKTLRAVKPAVISILGEALNHSSNAMRQAAVEVRNAWFLLDLY